MNTSAPETSQVTILEAQNVSVIRARRSIVDRVSLQLEAGTITSIIGPNGAGKSTLFKSLTGELVPDHGEIKLQGQPLARYSPQELSRQRAVLPQQSSLHFDFSVEQVVMLGRSPFDHHSSAASDQRIVETSLKRLDILPLKDRLYTSLSGGEQQRTQLARVLSQAQGTETETCKLLMMDEPTAALDIRHQIDLLKIARQEAKKGVAVLTILHDLNLAAQWSDRVVMMSNGKIIDQGCPQTVMTSESLESVFSIPMQCIQMPGSSQQAFIPNGL